MIAEPNIASVLVLDVGNTSLTFGVMRSDEVYTIEKLPVGDLSALPEALKARWEAMDPPRRIAASSVNAAVLQRVEQVVSETLGESVSVVGRDIEAPIETDLPEPERIGVDRLCCAAAAFERLQAPCVVVDFGTAITADCVNAEGAFVGGAIMPGMRMQADALNRGTAQLPQVELKTPEWVFGRNTSEAIVGGIVLGVRGAVRALVEAYATQLGTWPMVIYTGGDAELAGYDEGLVQAIVPELCLRGIGLALYKSLLPPGPAE